MLILVKGIKFGLHGCLNKRHGISAATDVHQMCRMPSSVSVGETSVEHGPQAVTVVCYMMTRCQGNHEHWSGQIKQRVPSDLL